MQAAEMRALSSERASSIPGGNRPVHLQSVTAAAPAAAAEDRLGPPRDIHRLDRRQTTQFMDLLEPNLGPLKRYVRSVLRYSPDADDVVQQTALKAFAHLDQFRFESQFGTWLRSIAFNEIRQLHRQRSGLRMEEGLSLDVADGRESAQAVWERKEIARAVRRAVRGLPATYRTIITLRYFDELDVAEIAERLSIGVGAVKARLHRARQYLAGKLGQTRSEAPRARAA